MTHQCNQLHSSHSGPFGHISLSLLLLTSPCSLVPQTLRLLHPLTNNTATLSASLLATRLDFKARIHNALALGISYIYRPMYTPVDRIIIDPTSFTVTFRSSPVFRFRSYHAYVFSRYFSPLPRIDSFPLRTRISRRCCTERSTFPTGLSVSDGAEYPGQPLIQAGHL